MKLIIDGYNLLKWAISSNYVAIEERTAFIRLIEQYALAKLHQIILVFDGDIGELPLFDNQESSIRTEVLYSGYLETADELIIRIISRLKGQELWLVTSDRKLSDLAKARGAGIIKSNEFYKYLLEFQHHKGQDGAVCDPTTYKTTVSDNEELDEIMRAARFVEKIETDTRPVRVRSKPAKNERERQRRLKKL